MKIFYIGFYNRSDSKIKRESAVSAVTKMDYVLEVLISTGYPIKLLSLSLVSENDNKFYKHEDYTLSDEVTLHYLPSFGNKSRIWWHIKSYWRSFFVLLYVLWRVSAKDKVVLYHTSSKIEKTILFLKKIIGFKLIVEVEEIYQLLDLAMPKKAKRMENEILSQADSYIYSTGMLNERCNKEGKPHITINGTYKVTPQRIEHIDDGMIHVLYAGTFDPRKGGAAAAAAAALLPSNYHVHICGFGTDEQIVYIKTLIEDLSLQSGAKLSYHGMLSGNEYLELVQKCTIGLSTQMPDAGFNATSFPSKILVYLSNGLRVVTVDIPAIRNSDVGEILLYYTQQTPEAIANAILNVDVNAPYDSRYIISELDKKTRKEINSVL